MERNRSSFQTKFESTGWRIGCGNKCDIKLDNLRDSYFIEITYGDTEGGDTTSVTAFLFVAGKIKIRQMCVFVTYVYI